MKETDIYIDIDYREKINGQSKVSDLPKKNKVIIFHYNNINDDSLFNNLRIRSYRVNLNLVWIIAILNDLIML
jgi:hypothetical protein